MSENWAAIAAEIARELAAVGMTVTLEKPGTNTGTAWKPVIGPPTLHEVAAVQKHHRVRDATGGFTGVVERHLTVPALEGITYEKGDRIRVNGQWSEITEVIPTAPAGVPVKYDLVLAN